MGNEEKDKPSTFTDPEEWYNDLAKRHEALLKRYALVEERERDLERNTSLSDEERIKILNSIANDYETIAKAMEALSEEAKLLAKQFNGGDGDQD